MAETVNTLLEIDGEKFQRVNGAWFDLEEDEPRTPLPCTSVFVCALDALAARTAERDEERKRASDYRESYLIVEETNRCLAKELATAREELWKTLKALRDIGSMYDDSESISFLALQAYDMSCIALSALAAQEVCDGH